MILIVMFQNLVCASAPTSYNIALPLSCIKAIGGLFLSKIPKIRLLDKDSSSLEDALIT